MGGTFESSAQCRLMVLENSLELHYGWIEDSHWSCNEDEPYLSRSPAEVYASDDGKRFISRDAKGDGIPEMGSGLEPLLLNGRYQLGKRRFRQRNGDRQSSFDEVAAAGPSRSSPVPSRPTCGRRRLTCEQPDRHGSLQLL